MKKTVFIGMLLVLASTSAFAGHRDSDIKLSVFDKQYFRVQLDGHWLGGPKHQVTLKNVDPGSHRLVVMSASSCTYNRTLFNGRIQVAPKSKILAKIDRHGRFVVKDVRRKTNYHGHNHGPNCGCTSCAAPTGGNCSAGCSGACGGSCDGQSQPYGYYEGHQAGFGQPAPLVMSSGAFNDLLRLLENQRFDDARMDIAENALARNAMTSLQVRDMLFTLTFERNRVELAKIAFDAVVDPGNFEVVTESFRFSNSVDELYAYVGG